MSGVRERLFNARVASEAELVLMIFHLMSWRKSWCQKELVCITTLHHILDSLDSMAQSAVLGLWMQGDACRAGIRTNISNECSPHPDSCRCWGYWDPVGK